MKNYNHEEPQVVTDKPQLIDIGCNLTHDSFDVDRDNVIKSAINQGVTNLIFTGADEQGSICASELAQRYSDHCYATAGIHPHEARTFSEQALSTLRELAQQEHVKALGEMGLDFNRNYSSHAEQEHAFERQLELACEMKLPVFLHQRDAHEHFYAILKTFRDKLTNVVVHCFTDTREALFDYLDLDCHIGITGWVCDERRGQDLQKIVSNIPLNRLMVESDAPYLLPRTISPKPKTRRNEPAFLPYVVETLTQCRGESYEIVADGTTKTAKAFFDI